jgi:hypothetical protein
MERPAKSPNPAAPRRGRPRKADILAAATAAATPAAKASPVAKAPRKAAPAKVVRRAAKPEAPAKPTTKDKPAPKAKAAPASPAPVEPPPPPAAPAPIATPDLSPQELWLVELHGALESELREFEARLDSILQAIGRDLREGVAALRGAARIARDEALLSTGGLRTVEYASVVEKLTGRLARLRAESSPSLAEFEKLSRRLRKAARRLGD